MRRFAVVLAFAAVGCGRFSGGCRGDYCGTLIFAAAGQPDILLPPVTESALARDIHDQLFLKLADLGMSTNTIGDRDFTPQLAQRWEWTGPKTLVFHLDPRARWQDGRPVTAGDVAFTFAVYTDPKVGASSRESLRRIASVTARDSLTAVFQFTTTYAEMFYDAVYDMRILPAHLLEHTPREQLSAAPFGRAPIGDGPYRFVSWRAGESIELAADSTFFLGRPHIRRLIWRFSHLVFWSGLRGALAIALALSLPAGLRQGTLLVRLTVGVVVFTLLVQGASVEPLLRWTLRHYDKGEHQA